MADGRHTMTRTVATLMMVGALGLLPPAGRMHAASAAAATVADAAMNGDRDAVRTLLKQGADVNASQGDGLTALHWAARKGDAELTQTLVAAHANVGAVTRVGGYTALHLAAEIGHAATI